MENRIERAIRNVKEYLLLISNNEVHRVNGGANKTFFYEVVDYYEDRTIDLYVAQLLTHSVIAKEIADDIQLLADNFYNAEEAYKETVPEEFWNKQKELALKIQRLLSKSVGTIE